MKKYILPLFLSLFIASNTLAWTNKPPHGILLNVASELTRGVVGYWRLIGPGGIAQDLSPFRNHGIINGATWESSSRGQVLGFLGAGATFVNCGNNASLSFLDTGESGSMWFWMQSPGVGGSSFPRIVSKSDGVNSRSFEILQHGALDQIIFQIYDGTVRRTVRTSSNYDDGAFRFFCVVSTPADNRWYVNGVDDSSDKVNTAAGVTNSLDVLIGASKPAAPSDFFRGYLYGVGFVGRALSDDEIMELYLNPSALLQPTQTIPWRMVESVPVKIPQIYHHRKQMGN